MEVSIAYNLMIRCVICIGIDICFVAGQLCTLYGEGCGIKYMKGTRFDCLCCCINCFLSSLCYIGSQFAQLNRSSLKSSGPVSIDRSSSATQLIAYSKYGSQFTLEDTRKVFGQALAVLPL